MGDCKFHPFCQFHKRRGSLFKKEEAVSSKKKRQSLQKRRGKLFKKEEAESSPTLPQRLSC
jgi:hypothetical protein